MVGFVTGVQAAAGGVLKRDRVLLALGAAGIVAAAWAFLVVGHPPPVAVHPTLTMPDHAEGPWALPLTFLMWFVMMVAMMLPPVMPWILLHARMRRQRRADETPLSATAVFAGGYFAVWAVYSLAAAAVQRALEGWALMGTVDPRTGPGAGGAILIVAGLFQWTPLKSACLAHCRSPLAFFLSEWRDGPRGAFQMGFRHGAYCVACCWALMAVSFALGVMNLLWMAGLTLMLCVEKIAPAGRRLGRLFGLVLVAWGGWLLLAP